MQLELFHGEHIPLIRARSALERGDLRGAHEAFANACAGGGRLGASDRLRLLERLLLQRDESSEPSPGEVHAAFATAFERGAQPARDPLSAGEWFRFYSAHMAQALARTPGRQFRGWCGLHFELATGRPRFALAAAGRLVTSTPAGWAWLEAARAAHAAGENAQACRWALTACLTSREPLHPDPPQLAPTGRRELDAPDFTLPGLPGVIDELWRDALELELADPVSAWVPSLGLIDGVFALAELRSPELMRASGLELERSQPGEPAPLAFLRALIAAREARARENPAGGGCGALELRARAEMKRADPQVFRRYMERLGLGLG